MLKKYRIYCCKDCGNKISRNSAVYGQGRCKSCTAKLRIGNKSPTFKNGNWCKINNCIDCNKKVSTPLTKRCSKCYHKYIKDNSILKGYKNGMYGVKGNKHHNFGIKRPEMEGKNNPSYIHGQAKRKYPSKFNSIRPFILNRDKYICQNCNMTQEEHLIVYGKDLEVHHIDYDKQNCKESNLITLCKGCNIRANFNRDYWKNLYNKKIEEIMKHEIHCWPIEYKF